MSAANTTVSNIGMVRLGTSGYVATTVSFVNSTMVRTGSTITVTLGTTTASTGAVTSSQSMRWTPAAGVTDRAGHALPTGNINETGANDPDF